MTLEQRCYCSSNMLSARDSGTHEISSSASSGALQVKPASESPAKAVSLACTDHFELFATTKS